MHLDLGPSCRYVHPNPAVSAAVSILDSIFGQSKVYKLFCQWYVPALNKGLAIWKRNCTQRVQIVLSRLVHIFTSFRGLIYNPYIRLSVKYHRAGLSHLVSLKLMSIARALSKTTAAAHSSFRLKAYNSTTNLQRSRSMSDDDDGTADISHAVQHFSLGLGVEGRCAFIEQKHGGPE